MFSVVGSGPETHYASGGWASVRGVNKFLISVFLLE
jgi:hypothetical protein